MSVLCRKVGDLAKILILNNFGTGGKQGGDIVYNEEEMCILFSIMRSVYVGPNFSCVVNSLVLSMVGTGVGYCVEEPGRASQSPCAIGGGGALIEREGVTP